uniref:FGGY_N domain-containing protein n=1 Tax=Macrostomum lignano TaxID=282301 RepID=A0A1I8HHQ8_9PLAT
MLTALRLLACRRAPRLPDIAPVGHVVGCLSPTLLTSLASGHAWAGRLPSSCRVRVPLGDLQCVVYSVYAPLQPSTLSSTSTGPADFDGRAFLNFGTSAQLGFLTSEPPQQPSVRDHAGIDCFPFFSPDRYVLLAASLNGGNVLAEFRPNSGRLARAANRTAVSVRDCLAAVATKPASASDPDPLISPTLLDERCGGGTQGGSVLGLRMSSCRSLGRLYRSVCLGLINNLLSLCPPAALRQAGIDRIILAGSALRRNAVLRRAAALRFDECQFQSIVLEDGGARQQPAVADGAAGLAAQFLDWVAAGRGES